MLENPRRLIRGDEHVVETEHRERDMLRPWHNSDRRTKNDCERAFGAYDRAREIEAATLGQLVKIVRRERGIQMTLYDAGFDGRDTRVRIDRDDAIHVFREIEHDRDVARLSCEAGATAPCEDRNRVLASDRKCREDITLVARNHY